MLRVLDPTFRLEVLDHVLRTLLECAILDAKQLRSLRRVVVDDMRRLLGVIRLISGRHIGIVLRRGIN